MKLNETILKAQKIIGENDELIYHLWASDADPISAHIGLRKIQDTDGLLHLEIILDSDTTFDELDHNWKKILSKRRRLVEVQVVVHIAVYQDIWSARGFGKDYSVDISLPSAHIF